MNPETTIVAPALMGGVLGYLVAHYTSPRELISGAWASITLSLIVFVVLRVVAIALSWPPLAEMETPVTEVAAWAVALSQLPVALGYILGDDEEED